MEAVQAVEGLEGTGPALPSQHLLLLLLTLLSLLPRLLDARFGQDADPLVELWDGAWTLGRGSEFLSWVERAG